MADLSAERCVECLPGSPPVTQAERDELLPAIPAWAVIDDGMEKLERTYTFGNFVDALAFTNRVGDAAEAEGHHPEISVTWGRATVRWWTHSIGGLHRNDFIMAARTDTLLAG